MASNLPKFGNWDAEESVNYTTYFENARRVSSSEQINTNTPRNNHDPISKQEVVKKGETLRKAEHKVSREDGEVRRPLDSPSHHDLRHKVSGDSTSQQPAGVSNDAPKMTARSNGSGFPSADHSPLHPHYQAKLGVKGGAISSPSREKKGAYEGTQGLAPSTPGRSRLRSVPRGNETPDRGASVPKFGEWDETDPSSADGFSYIFNRVKEERHGSGGNPSSDPKLSIGQRHFKTKNAKGCCCFPWGGN